MHIAAISVFFRPSPYTVENRVEHQHRNVVAWISHIEALRTSPNRPKKGSARHERKEEGHRV